MSTSVKATKPDRGMKKAPNAWSKPLHKKKSKSPPPKDLLGLRERYLHLLLTLTGQKVTVTLKNHSVVSGVLHAATPFDSLPAPDRFKYVLKAITVEKGDLKPGSTLILDMNNVVQLHVKSCKLESLNSNNAFTDAEISSRAPPKKTKELEKAGSAWTTEVTKAALMKGTIAGWDQFKANEEQFGVKAEFDENLYTTKLDKSNLSRSEQLKAEKLAKEIERSSTTNMHIAEERNQAVSQDYDEEDRYSGVLKQQPKPRLNYAQAAAPKAAPPGFAGGEEKKQVKKVTAEKPEPPKKPEPPNESKPPSKEPEKPKPPKDEPEVAVPTEPIETTVEEKKPAEEKAPAIEKPAEEPTKSKLNPGAKEFSLNIGAKPFTPGLPQHQQQYPPPPPPQFFQYPDPNSFSVMQPMMHYMQPGMIPHMMHYPGMRYPGQYPGPEQFMMTPQGMHQVPPTAPSAASASVGQSEHTSRTASPVPISDEGSSGSPSEAPKPMPQEDDSLGPPPPGGVANHLSQMPMHPQFQGYFHHPGAMHPHMMHPPHPGMMQQRPMYPMQHIPSRFFQGPNGPMPYPFYEEDMNYGRSGGRGGRGNVRGGGGRRGGGRGRGNRGDGRDGRGGGRSRFSSAGGYHSNSSSGRQTPQSNNNTPPPPSDEGATLQQGPPPSS